MEEFVNSILDFIVDNGLLTAVCGTLTPIVVKALVSGSFRSFIIVGLKHLVKAIFKDITLTHRVFYNIERYKNMAYRIRFNDTKKTKLFQILLETKLDTTKNKITAWSKDNKKLLNSSKKMELRNALEELTIDIINTYEIDILANYFKYLESKEDAIFYFNLSYNGSCNDCADYKKTQLRCEPPCKETLGFKEYHTTNVQFIDRFIETIPECEGESNRQIFSYYLNYIDNALYSAVHDAKTVFTLQNGRYKRVNKENNDTKN